MITFNKYTSIENSYQIPYMMRVKEIIPKEELWDITEKVHGSNCCLITDGNEVVFGKRSGLVQNEKFFNYELVLAEHQQRILDAFNYIKEEYYTELPIKTVQFYGELFGGTYPHPDIPRDNRFEAVQKGLYYAPYQSFYGFDIAYILEDDNRYWMNPDAVVDIYKTNNIFYAKSLFRGTLEECLKFNNAFQTNIPEWLGLPPIENNICEGVVLKPMNTYYIGDSRIVIKNKNEKFAEVKKSHVPKEKKELPLIVMQLTDSISNYINDNRLCNVLSHEGEFEMPKDMGKLLKIFNEDILNDFVKDNIAIWNTLDKSNQKLVTKGMVGLAANVIKQHYQIR